LRYGKRLFVLNPFPPFIPDFRLNRYRLPISDDPIFRAYLSSLFMKTQLVGVAIQKELQAKTALGFETTTKINQRDGRVRLALLVCLSITQKGW
jgi:hypothetical protein